MDGPRSFEHVANQLFWRALARLTLGSMCFAYGSLSTAKPLCWLLLGGFFWGTATSLATRMLGWHKVIRMTDDELMNHFADIAWREPLPLHTPHGSGFGCRFCIARFGFKGRDVTKLPQTLAEFEAHLQHFHPA